MTNPVKLVSDLEEIKRKIFSKKKCEAKNISECNGKIIAAHSISRKFLKAIEKKGQVLCFDDGLWKIIKNGGKTGVRKVGVSQASTYQMFCNYHDKSLFSPLEDEELIPNEFQCFLLMYRALIVEKYTKESQVAFLSELVNYGAALSDLRTKQLLLEGAKKGASDMYAICSDICSDMKNNDYSKFRALRLYFKKKPHFFCAGAFHPEYDFNKEQLFGLQSKETLHDFLSVNILPLVNNKDFNGVAVLAWRNIDCQSDSNRLIQSMHSIPMSDISNVLIYLVLDYIENVCLSPGWWETLNGGTKNLILELHKPFEHEPHSYMEIGVQIDDWNVAKAELWNGESWEEFCFS